MTEILARDVRRILVALDLSWQDLDALNQAVTLAEKMRIELVALLVEDENLLQLAGLPFAQEVHRVSGQACRLDRPQLAQMLKFQAEKLRQTVLSAARQREVSATVKVVRGQFTRIALTAAIETDAVFLGVPDRSGAVPSTATAAKPTARLVDRQSASVWVVFDGSPASLRALRLAAELGAADGRTLTLVLPSAADEQAARLRTAAEQALAEQRLNVLDLSLREFDPTGFGRAIRRADCALLILCQDSPLLRDADARALLANVACPVVVVC